MAASHTGWFVTAAKVPASILAIHRRCRGSPAGCHGAIFQANRMAMQCRHDRRRHFVARGRRNWLAGRARRQRHHAFRKRIRRSIHRRSAGADCDSRPPHWRTDRSLAWGGALRWAFSNSRRTSAGVGPKWNSEYRGEDASALLTADRRGQSFLPQSRHAPRRATVRPACGSIDSLALGPWKPGWPTSGRRQPPHSGLASI